MARHITREQLRVKIERGDDFVLLETLPAASYAYGHLPGALHLPPDEVERAPELIPTRDTEVVVYCASRTCTAASHALHELDALGYTRVLYYIGGKADWKEAGLPMEGQAAETPGSEA